MSFDPIFTVPTKAFTTGASLTGTLTRTSLASVVIKGGTLNANDIVVFVYSVTATNNANNKTYELEFGSTNIMNTVDANNAGRVWIKTVQNRNSLTSQVSTRLSDFNSYGTTATALVTLSENTANDITVSFYATLTNTGDTVTINYIIPMIWKGKT